MIDNTGGRKMKFLKAKKLWVSVGVVIGLVGAYSLGKGADARIGDEIVSYNELVSRSNELTEKLKHKKDAVEKAIEDEQKKLEDKKSEVTETLAMVKKRDELSTEIERLGKDAEAKKGEVGRIDGEIEAKKGELQKVTEGVKAKQEEPRALNAGEYIVGKDIPSGRYKATATGGGSNFVVYDSKSGSAVVNTILGNSSVGRGDYTFFTGDGDIIKTAEPVKLIPVE